ncbi:DUF6177 family protein [Streptomyces sp. NPDC059785]|uniref:DUF6177 family protein n=1 Tax=Streptomyces sp. NPDC059785 TaxID=3346945 RepID=UPI0036578F88
MTKDVIALTPEMPDLRALLAGFYAGGPDVGVSSVADGAVVQLCAPDERALVSVEAPVLVQVPGEAARLLEGEVGEGAVWWTEARASTAVAEAGRLAGSFAGRLATVSGGEVWPAEAATTDVVPLNTDVSANPAPDGGPAVDVLTDTTAVVMQDRPLVPMSSWLGDAMRTAAEAGRALQIVTPPATRLTLPTRTALRGLPNRWVVRDAEHGYYDGLSGALLQWENGTFAPVRDERGATRVAEGFRASDPVDAGERQLVLSLRVRHPAVEGLVLGSAVESVFRHLTGGPPAGWSTAEPVNLPWSTRTLTEFARARAPRPTLLVVVGRPGRPALATVRVLRTPAGVEEDVTLAFGYGSGETPPLSAVEGLAAELDASHPLVSMLTAVRAGRRDLTVPARLEASPVPVSFTLGRQEVERVGLTDLTSDVRPPIPPVRLGDSAQVALHFPLSDGTDPRAWSVFQQLTRQLKACRER